MEKIIFSSKRTSHKRGIRVLVLLFLVVIISFEAFTFLAVRKSRQPVPPLFGNFAEIRSDLEKAAPQKQFSFAVFGDTEGATASFDLLASKLRAHPVDFAVHLGDAFAKTYPYFRSKLSDLALPFPVFWVAGNHDLDDFSLVQYEEVFGPSLFSFVYQECLFVGLRVQGDAAATAASLQFLENTLQEAGKRTRPTFVFMHVPPPVLPGHKFAAPAKFIELCERYQVGYVISGHYHGYAQVAKGGTTYLVSGAAGKHLEETPYGQFHHALVLTVGPDFVAKTVVPLAAGYSLENKLQRYALVEFYPWVVQHRELAAFANLIVLLLLGLTIKALSGRKR